MKKFLGILVEALSLVLMVYIISGITDAFYDVEIVHWFVRTDWLYPITAIGTSAIVGIKVREFVERKLDRVLPHAETHVNWITVD